MVKHHMQLPGALSHPWINEPQPN